MTTDLFDKCVSVSSSFDLNAVHNGEACIASLDPKDERENKFWFTIAMFVTIFNESDKTIRNNIEELAQEGELGDCKIFQRRINIEDSCGVPHPTTIYNLAVLNRLGMCCFRKNRKAKEVRDKFNDVLLDRETGVQPRELTEEEILMQANAILTRRVAAITAEREAAQLALTVEAAEHKHDNCVKNGKCGGITKNRNHYKTKSETLAVENEELKDAVGRGSNWRTISMMKSEWVREFGHAPVWQKLKQFSVDVGIDPKRDVEEKVVLPDGREKVHLSFRYHREAWARYRKYEENLRVTDTEIENV